MVDTSFTCTPFDMAKIGGGKNLLGYRYVNVRLTEIFITFAPKTRTKWKHVSSYIFPFPIYRRRNWIGIQQTVTTSTIEKYHLSSMSSQTVRTFFASKSLMALCWVMILCFQFLVLSSLIGSSLCDRNNALSSI